MSDANQQINNALDRTKKESIISNLSKEGNREKPNVNEFNSREIQATLVTKVLFLLKLSIE